MPKAAAMIVPYATERPEGIEAGTLLLAGIEEERIYQLATDLLTNEETYKKMATASNPNRQPVPSG